jgi:hypothetical protein
VLGCGSHAASGLLLELQWLPLDACKTQHSSCSQQVSRGSRCLAWLLSERVHVPCLACHRTGLLRRNQLYPYAVCHLSHLSVVPLQLVQEFKLLLLIGRRLVFPAQSGAAVRADLTTHVQFKAADGTTAMRTVSLMFPANCRTVVRLMEAWYDAQVGLSLSVLGLGRTYCLQLSLATLSTL